ncbi:protein kinase domain-containing protein [Sorangium sp. So ce1335]|uniref:protein kinase domain-containing protein n=1 Tax=Sorangium sp. So ce1335 TaxID=3133335 RepID=UPI003F62F5E4
MTPPRAPEAPRPFACGEVLAGRFAVERPIGEGSFGWVFAATDLSERPPRRVAIKVLRHERAAERRTLRRFEQRELALLRRVHAAAPAPNVVRALSPVLFAHRGLPFLVLELIEGPSLREVLAARGPLPPGEARRIGAGLARGLASIHAALGVHRDLKPSNVRLRAGGEPVILDLGIARALWLTQETTASALPWMTPRYAAPEQLAGGPASPASDVYALGLLLHEMLAGEVPLAGRTREETREAREARDTPCPPAAGAALPEDVAALVRRCLARDPARRPAAAEVAEALAAPARPRAAARRAPLGVAALLLAAGGASSALGLLPGARAVTGAAPVALYPLDDLAGARAEDLAGGNDALLVHGPAPVAGRIGGALRFDGVDDHVEAPHAASLDVGQGDLTITAWLQTTSAEGIQVIVDKRDEGPRGVHGYCVFLSRGRLSVQLADRDASPKCTMVASTACTNYLSGAFVADGRWHHIAVTVDRRAVDGGTFYVDGAVAGRFDPTARPLSLDSRAPLRIGSRSSSESGFFRGVLDEVALYRRALSPEEVAAAALQGAAPGAGPR